MTPEAFTALDKRIRTAIDKHQDDLATESLKQDRSIQVLLLHIRAVEELQGIRRSVTDHYAQSIENSETADRDARQMVDEWQRSQPSAAVIRHVKEKLWDFVSYTAVYGERAGEDAARFFRVMDLFKT